MYVGVYILLCLKKTNKKIITKTMSKRPKKKKKIKITKDTFFNSIQVRSTSDATNWRTPDVLNIKFTSTMSPNSSFGSLTISLSSNTVRYAYTRPSYTRVNMLQISA